MGIDEVGIDKVGIDEVGRYPLLLLLQDVVTASMIAVYYGHSHIVQVLIRFKPDVNLQTKVGVLTYCSVCSACVCCAVTCYI